MTLPSRQEVAPALLRVLHQLGGEAPVREVIPLVTDAFPEITTDDLALTVKSGRSKWENLVYWARQDMIEAGHVWSPERGIWALSEQGREKAAALTETAAAPAPHHHDSPADDDDAEPPEPEEEDSTAAAAYVAVLANESDRIVSDLKAAETNSSDPKHLETAVADALRFLGFDSERIGGPGRTDVLAVAHLGVDRYAVVIDAKSTATGKVGDQQVDWESVTEHRQQERARYSCIVGPAFAGGNLRERAAKHGTRLLTAAQLAEVVQTHADSPVSLKILEQLFDASIDAATALRDVQSASRENDRRRRLPLKLVRIIDQVNHAKTTAAAAKAESLWFVLAHSDDDDDNRTTREEVEAALSLLETHGILRRSNGEGYVSQTSFAGAKQILEAAPTDPPPNDDPPDADSGHDRDAARAG